MAVKISKINKSAGRILKTPDNLKKLSGSDQKGRWAGQKLAQENDVCCGLGRKILYFATPGGQATKIKSYPLTIGGVRVQNKKELEEQINVQGLGAGYIYYVVSSGNVEVLGASYKKDADGQLADVPDFISISKG